MLIVLEGLDGAGKSTQVKKLKEYLTERCGALEYIHFPRYDAPVYGDLIGRFLKGEFGSIEAVHPQLVALLFAEDRRDAAGLLRSWTDQGHVVVLDRYVYSNIAFQCAKLADPQEAAELRDWILDLEYVRFGIPRPTLNLFLDVPVEFVDAKLRQNRQGGDRRYLEGKSDIHEADIAFQIRVRDLYREQCGLDASFLRIDCADAEGHMLPAADIFLRIRQQIDRVL